MEFVKKHRKIVEQILEWYAANARDLPWRNTKDPYKIWASEIMLQQTQVSRVIDYYKNLLGHYPSVNDLAKAEWDDFLPIWRGLGFYSRGRNMLKTAKIIAEDYNGEFPQSLTELQKLPGVGPYTAAAIMSFAFDQPVAAIDTNLERVIQRVFGCTKQSIDPRAKALFAVDQEKGAALNHALMDLGSALCKGRKVYCERCPLQNECHFLQSGTKQEWEQGLLNIKAGKIIKSKKPAIEVAAACIHKNGKYLICQKPVEKGGGWEFPGGKREKGEDWRHCLKREIDEELKIEISARPHFYEATWEDAQYFWRIRFARCQILKGEPVLTEHQKLLWVPVEQLGEYNFPAANAKAIERLKKFKS
jgi:A/G-specific adenine glycosylase